MTFIPYQYPIQTPRRSDQLARVPEKETTPAPAASCVIPIGVESEIGDPLNPTVVSQRDVFLLHPYESSFQRLLVGASQDTTPDFLSVQIVQKDGTQETPLTPERVFKALRVTPEVIQDATPWAKGPVFLRLRATYSAARLLATVETLTTEVQ